MWFALSIKIILFYSKFHFKQKICGEEHQYTTGSSLFFLKKVWPKKQQEKNVKIDHLTIVLIKVRLIIFLVFSHYGLPCKYGTALQMSIYNWLRNCIF